MMQMRDGEAPKRKVSRYTVRPGTLGLTCRSTCAGTHGVTGRFLFRTLGVPLVVLNTDKCNAHLFCSSYSLNKLVSDAKKRVVNYAVACSINAVS